MEIVKLYIYTWLKKSLASGRILSEVYPMPESKRFPGELTSIHVIFFSGPPEHCR